MNDYETVATWNVIEVKIEISLRLHILVNDGMDCVK